MSKRLTLKDLLQKIDWVQIENVRATWKLGDDKIAVGFFKTKKDTNSASEVKIRFGKEVMEKLKWEPGDRVLPYHHPDDLMSFMIVKSDTSKGYVLSKETGHTTTCKISFKWDRPISINERKCQEVDFLTPKDKYIVFRVTDSDDE